MTAPTDKPPAFCAHCVEERAPLTRCIRRGRTVWICAQCLDPLGALRIHDVPDRDASAMPGAPSFGRSDGNSRRGGRT